MADPADPPVWFVRTGGVEKGPLTGAVLRGLAASGRVSEASAVRKAGGPWRPAAEVRGLLSPAEPATPPPPEPTPEPPAPDPPPPPVEFAAAPSPDPPASPFAGEFIDPAEVALALDDAPASRPSTPPADGGLRGAAGLRGVLRGAGDDRLRPDGAAVLRRAGGVRPRRLVGGRGRRIGRRVGRRRGRVGGSGRSRIRSRWGSSACCCGAWGKGVEAFADIAGNVAALRG